MRLASSYQRATQTANSAPIELALPEVQAIGVRTFDLSHSSCSVLSPKTFRWTKESQDVQVYFDEAIIEGAAKEYHPNKYGWFIESIGHRPDLFHYLRHHYAKVLPGYAAIFTSIRELLDLDERFVFSYSGSNLPWTPIEDQAVYRKSKLCSMIASPLTVTRGHRKRHELAERFESLIDLFGGAANSKQVRDTGGFYSSKLPMLQDYFFSIVIENASYETYFTEKISDCFATGTIPVYWGAPDIGRYFNSDGIIPLTEDFHPEQLSEALYCSKFKAVEENFQRIQSMTMADDYLFAQIQAAFPLKEKPEAVSLADCINLREKEPTEAGGSFSVPASLPGSAELEFRGFHDPEYWGRWSSLAISSLQLPYLLPQEFSLSLHYRQLIESGVQTLRVWIGDEVKTLELEGSSGQRVLEFQLLEPQSAIYLCVDSLHTPLELIGVDDTRQIGFGLEYLSVTIP